MPSKFQHDQDPGRFTVSRSTLVVDAFMTHFIKIGGIGIILAVCAIFVFILLQVLPLFRGAEVRPVASVPTGIEDFAFIGVDEWSELPFFVDEQANFTFVDLAYPEDGVVRQGPRGVFSRPSGLPEDTQVTALRYHRGENEVAAGLADGRFAIIEVAYRAEFSPTNERTIEVDVEAGELFRFSEGEYPIVALDYFASERSSAFVAGILEREDGSREARVAAFRRQRTLFGSGDWQIAETYDLTLQLDGVPEQALINGLGSRVIILTRDGTIASFVLEGGEARLQQTFKPFSDLENPAIATADWLLGNESLVVTSATGAIKIAQPAVASEAGDEIRYVIDAKTFEPLSGEVDGFAKSVRNRAFLVTQGRVASLCYATTETIRWQGELPFDPESVVIGARYDRILAAEADGTLQFLSINDPHPESGFKAFFGRIWYEGQAEPAYVYQASAATESAEAKYSMVNLLWGSLKGTFFALIFAMPISLLAAVYTSQFLHPDFKKIIKPTMEVMASLPSVVLGFLGGLWLAPLIETRMPSVILILTLLPAVALIFGAAWACLPQRFRLWVRPGWEFALMIPLLLLTTWAGWQLGPLIEQVAFVVELESGARVADFRLWWPSATGEPFLPRNAVVVGFMMGFAVIPIIFTIAEDSMSNVPGFLTSASLALGASRWQTAWHIVLPTASAGIFSALMIGLGRAVGETMIVVMCSGNTPIFDFPLPNPFDGMRTLSANIAMELREAPKFSTHYRILYLGALLLFLLTFFVNTAAEVLRNRLREKYKTVG
ncbi:MAG: ABC transporter permease subunit [Opitutales bacterium]